MRKFLPFLLFILSIGTGAKSFAQGFATEHGDTVIANFNGATTLNVLNALKSGGSTSVVVSWRVTDYQFAPGMGSEGFCDNKLCQDSAHALSGAVYTSNPYSTAWGDFHALFKDYGAANNTASWVKVNVTEGTPGTIGGMQRTLVFIARKNNTTSIGNTNREENSVNVFPNPARDFVNVVFDKDADVKTIAVFNLIGKTMRVFRPADNNSAKLDLDNIPSGVYFLRLMNSAGQVVATRRFTRQ